MTRPLVWLLLARRRNAVKKFVAGLRRPRRILGLLGTLGLVGLVAWSVSQASGSTEAARAAAAPLLRGYLSLVLLMSFLGGLSERGLAFHASDVHFLFPGPFRRRDLILYHLADQAPMVALGALLPFLFFGLRAPNPGLALLGCLLAVFAAQHVRIFASVAMVHVGERAFRRMRTPLRWLMTLSVLALVVLLAAAATRAGGLRQVVGTSTSSPVLRVLFYPAAAAGDLAEAGSLVQALAALLGGATAVLVTLVAVLLLQVNFLEQSIDVSERWAERRARLRRTGNAAAASAREGPVQGVRLPSLGAFRGTGALVWKNVVVARRSLRALFVSIAIGVFLVTPMLAAARDRDPGLVLGYVVILPLLLSGSLTFDFRGEGAQIGALRSLPFTPTAVALAEVVVPSAIALLCQSVYLAAAAGLGFAPMAWAALAFVACVPVTATMVAATNLAWFWAPRGAGAALLQFLFLLGNGTILGLLAWLLLQIGLEPWIALSLLFAAQVALLSGVLALLGRAFVTSDVSEDAA